MTIPTRADNGVNKSPHRTPEPASPQRGDTTSTSDHSEHMNNVNNHTSEQISHTSPNLEEYSSTTNSQPAAVLEVPVPSINKDKMGSASESNVITILHFNDVYNIEPREIEPVGGAARFTTAIRSRAELNPLVLFSGDAFNPSLSGYI